MVVCREDEAYKYFGAHKLKEFEGKHIYTFRLMYENADSVELVWNFSSDKSYKLSCLSGVWEIIYESDIPLEGMKYKYRISKNGISFCIPDPLGFYNDASDLEYTILKTYEEFTINVLERKAEGGSIVSAVVDKPLNICAAELVFSEQNQFYDSKKHKNYADLSDPAVKFLDCMSFTHIEMSVKPFCICTAYGTAEDLFCFCEALKTSSKGVIARMNFDSVLFNMFTYESDDFKKFFLSSVLFWIKELRADGVKLSVDKLLHFGEEKYIESLLEALRSILHREKYGALIIVEGDLDIPRSNGEEGCRFFKVNQGWQKDTVDYFFAAPKRRHDMITTLTFPFKYACSGDHVLNLVVNQMLSKTDIKLLLGLFITHPGKKSISGDLADIFFSELCDFYEKLNGVYIKNEALWELDSSENGFRWVFKGDCNEPLIAFERYSKIGSSLMCVFNLSEKYIRGFEVFNVSGHKRSYRKIFISDDAGGEKTDSAISEVDLPPFSFVLLERLKI